MNCMLGVLCYTLKLLSSFRESSKYINTLGSNGGIDVPQALPIGKAYGFWMDVKVAITLLEFL